MVYLNIETHRTLKKTGYMQSILVQRELLSKQKLDSGEGIALWS